MSIPVGGYLEMVTYCQLGDQLGLNVLHYRIASCSEDPCSEQLIVNSYATYVKTKYADMLVSSAAYIGCALRRLEPDNIGGYYYKRDAAPGNNDPDALPRQVAGLISWRTGTTGRRGRGRSYIAFPAEPDNTADYIPSTGYATRLGALRDALINTGALSYGDFGAVTLTLQIKRADIHSYTPVVFGIAPRKWATCRRRGSFGRPNVLPDGLTGVV